MEKDEGLVSENWDDWSVMLGGKRAASHSNKFTQTKKLSKKATSKGCLTQAYLRWF
jgi:hypothetical protein